MDSLKKKDKTTKNTKMIIFLSRVYNLKRFMDTSLN